ncbi:efflux transporter outer membrane subunit [Phenylobacterium sp.]|uniref:efflux transporter outer membrane subunit n=1 Tax=Phenylobacterium sp. TaxID=1871053 RepID=UPI0012115EFD|nr:efflux transporter outer membrane subunit [Phenylobacterium sp.]THD58941.1 MAG: efflux transporter outer membrane subunit [Phenylobacterium sp.]
MTRPRLTLARFSALGAAAALLGGCVVGPNYKGPPTVAPQAAHAPAFHRGDAVTAGEPASHWWTALNDAELDALVDEALRSSPDLAVARARIVQARAGLKGARAQGLPTTGTTAAYLRATGLSGALGGGQASGQSAAAAGLALPSTLEIYTADFDATWELDLFGGKRRGVEGAKAKAQAADAAFDGAKVSLEAEVAQAYVTLRQLQQRMALSRRDADLERQMLDLTRQRQAGGTASELDVEKLNNQFQSTQAQIVPLQAQITEQLDRLAVLTGREPGALDAELSAAAATPAPPAVVAVGDPAALLRRRPDIRQAERQLQQANAVIGERTADLFPKVTLLGSIGYTAPELSHLFDSSSQSTILAPLLQWTPFDFGRVRAQIAEAKGADAEALATYRKTVLEALQDAETSLSRYGRQRDSLESLLRVQASAERSATLEALRQKGGTATTLEVLDTERQRVQAEQGVADARAQLTNDFIALQKSLGLGWS